jgi:16S rRNA G966 N2-methylase RsmD
VALVDIDVDTATANVESLHVLDRVELVRRDALSYLASEPGRFDLILCDPPYTLAARVARDLQEHVRACLRPGGRLVTESSARAPMLLDLELEHDRAYGETSIRVWRLA